MVRRIADAELKDAH